MKFHANIHRQQWRRRLVLVGTGSRSRSSTHGGPALDFLLGLRGSDFLVMAVWLGLVGSLAVLGCLGTYQRIHVQIYDLGAPSLRNQAVIITGALSISS
jgi:hypothetical protein